MQTDGSLVIYAADGIPIWSTNTYAYPGSGLYLQSDGNLVIYYYGYAVWHTSTGE